MKLYTLHYFMITGGGDTGEPEEKTLIKATDLTKNQYDSLIYSIKHGDFGCDFSIIPTK